ncbi:MAG TPA: ROK family protein [Pseudonocardia sp.]|jgi:predicted NBD/HSP70 family sugar kinase|nr:ROK family protein [Pseudonocardia sp.]
MPTTISNRPAASVLTEVRTGPVFRDELARATELSNATVNRQVAGLLAAGLVRERPDLAPAGTVGRPRIPVELEPDGFGVLGLHIGLRRSTLAASDLRGRVFAGIDVPNPVGDPAEVLSALTRRLLSFGARWPERTMLQVGVVTGGHLSAERDTLRHPQLGWDDVPIADIVAQASGAEVAVLPQVEAMARADMLRAVRRHRGSTLYVYARDAVDAVLTVDGNADLPTRNLGTISHLPVGGSTPCTCGSVGCLESSAGDSAVAEAALRAGVVTQPSLPQVVDAAVEGNRTAHELLVDRARLLGRGVALVRDVLNPDRVVLLGQAFTAYRPALAHISAAFAARSALAPLSLQVSPLGPGVQALAACTAALLPVYADPLGAVRREQAGRRLSVRRTAAVS